jgi:hypothetical protein
VAAGVLLEESLLAPELAAQRHLPRLQRHPFWPVETRQLLGHDQSRARSGRSPLLGPVPRLDSLHAGGTPPKPWAAHASYRQTASLCNAITTPQNRVRAAAEETEVRRNWKRRTCTINFLAVDRMDILGRLRQFRFHVVNQVRAEVRFDDQRGRLQAAMEGGAVTEIEITDPGEIRLYDELRRVWETASRPPSPRPSVAGG